MTVSLECDHIFRVSLGVVEDDEHGGVGHFVHHTVVLLKGHGSAFGRCDYHALLSEGEIPRQNSTQVHALLPVCIRLGVGVRGRVVSIDSKVCAIAITSS